MKTIKRSARIGSIVNGRPLNPSNPSQGYEMTRPHEDKAGNVWPTGTRYQLSSMGTDGQTVGIAGQMVSFPHYRAQS